MYKVIVLLLTVSCSLTSIGQQNFPIDSLLREADAVKADSTRMRIFNRIGNYYLNNNASKAIEYYEKAKALGTILKDSLRVANNYYDIGFANFLKADYQKSLAAYLVSAKKYEELNDSYRLSNAFMSIGNVYLKYKDFKKTDEYYDKAEALIVATKDSLQLTSIYDTKGITFDQMGQFDSALYYSKKSYDISLLLNENDYAMNSLSNMALTYKHQFKTKEALAAFDSVVTFYERKKDAPLDVLASAYNNVGATQAQAGNYPKAIEAFNKSIGFARQTGASETVMENYRNMADMYGGMKNYAQQAFYLKQYHQLKDSIYSAGSKNQLTQLEADYQLEKKNSEISKKDAEVVKQTSQRNIFIIIAIATVLILTTLAFFYTRIRKNNAALKQKNIQISEQRNELQTLNHVKDRLFSIISHDLRNPLATLKSYLSLADNDNVAAEKKQQFKLQTMNAVLNTSDMLDNLLAWANVQIKNTRANILPLSVEDAIWDTVHSVQAQAMQKEITIRQDVQAATALGDYDILIIALRNIATNAIKYSNPGTNIYISSVKKGNEVLISLRDEGIGISKEKIAEILHDQTDSTQGTQGEKGSGLGLFLVKELLQKSNAGLRIESGEGKGSTFTVMLPA